MAECQKIRSQCSSVLAAANELGPEPGFIQCELKIEIELNSIELSLRLQMNWAHNPVSISVTFCKLILAAVAIHVMETINVCFDKVTHWFLL